MATAAVDKQWELHKATIRRLYLVENKTLGCLRRIMKEQYRFPATKAQFEFRLKQWKFQKNIPPHVWRRVDQEIRKRQREGKTTSEVVYSGVVLPWAKVEKATKRYRFAPTVDESTLDPKRHDDVCAWVQTPPPSHPECLWPPNLPWFDFQDPFLEVAFSCVESCHEGPLAADTILRQVLRASRRPPSAIDDLDIVRNPSRASLILRNIMPEKFPGENLVRSESLSCSGANDLKIGALEVLFFLASNNMPGAINMWSLDLDVFIIGLLRQSGLLRSLLLKSSVNAAPQPSAVALFHQLFSSAVRVSDMDVLAILLKGGADPNQPVSLKYLDLRPRGLPVGVPFVPGPTILPLQLAVSTCNTDLANLLLKFGADANRDVGPYSVLDLAILACASKLDGETGMIKLVLDKRSQPTTSEWLRALEYATLCGDSSSSRFVLDVLHERPSPSPDFKARMLVDAIRNEYDGMIQAILNMSRANLNTVTSVGRYALWDATYSRRHDLCELLLRSGASANSPQHNIPSPLQCAAYQGDTEAIQLLLRHNADINSLNAGTCSRVGHAWAIAEPMFLGRTALEAALYGGQVTAAEMLLGKGAQLFGSELIIAIRQRLPTLIVERLLESGVCTDSTGGPGETALEAAIATGQFETANRILRLDAFSYDPRALCAVVHMAIITSDYSVVEAILQHRDPGRTYSEFLEGTALGVAAHFSNRTLVETILDHGILPPVALIPPDRDSLLSPASLGFGEGDFSSMLERWSDESGWWNWDIGNLDVVSPLELAVAGDSSTMVSYLLQLGCEPTPGCMLRAAANGLTSCLRALLDAGADVDWRQSDLDTPLQAAVHRQHVGTVKFLLKAGADVNAAPSHRDVTIDFVFRYASTTRSALQAAVELGNLELVGLLLEYGADINAAAGDGGGATALQLAAIQGFLGIAKNLLDRGADCNAPAAKCKGRTALEGAAEHGRIDMLQLLLSTGVDTQGPARGQFARGVRLALDNGHQAAANILMKYGDLRVCEEPALVAHSDSTQPFEAHSPPTETAHFERVRNAYDAELARTDLDSQGSVKHSSRQTGTYSDMDDTDGIYPPHTESNDDSSINLGETPPSIEEESNIMIRDGDEANSAKPSKHVDFGVGTEDWFWQFVQFPDDS